MYDPQENDQESEYEWVQTRLNFVDAIEVGFSGYSSFTGRASRSSFWWWTVAVCLIMAVSLRLAHLDAFDFMPYIAGGVLLCPTVAITVRRLHDTGHGAWWLLLALLPVAGWLVLLIFFLWPSDKGSNDYGHQPNLIRTDML